MRKLVITLILLCMTSAFIEASEWTGTWSCSVYSDSQLNTTFDNMTLRQVVRVSIPGNQVRLSFSNLFGSTPLEIQKVHLAQSAGGHTINTGTDLTVTFSGSESVTIPSGGTVTSDVLTYSLPALTNMAITIYFGDVPSTVSGHVGSRTTSYWQSGDAVANSSLSSPASDTHWYVIDRIDVYREDAARAVSCFGDSITDGYGTTTDAQNRWTDFLATRLQGVTETSDVGVLNAGIGATTVTGSGLNRLQRDVLDQTDVKYLIVVYGVNDIGGSTSVSSILSAYQSIITDAHNNGILVYGGTITPFGGSGYYSSTNESERQQVNSWIRTTSSAAGGFDVVIDFDAALRDPSDPTRLLPVYSNDGLHPSIAGYEAMADAIDLALFSLDETPPAEPTGLTATAQSYKQIDLDWNNNSEEDFSHYNVWRSTNSGGPYTEAATVTSSAYSDVDPADRLSPSTTYYYVVTSVDNSGNESTYSAQSQATTDDLPADTDPPTPNPATWYSVPTATGATVITMTADTGSDPYGPVEYYFTCTAGGGHDSDWQTSPTYTDSDLSPDTQYIYTVVMRDDLGNVGTGSAPASTTTWEGPGEFQESGGIVSMEAENGVVGGTGWVEVGNASASNGACIENMVNYTGQSAPECTSPECIASYEFNISTTGNYRFWFRTYSNSYDDDSLFWRIDNGTWIFENGRSGFGSWYATDHTQVDSLSAGSHTLEIGYREDGTILDKFVIQLDALPDPTGDGPDESSQTQGSDENPPSAPTNLSASVSETHVDLTWSASTGASGYSVKRSTVGGGPYTVIEPNTPSTSYSDDTVVAGATYYYVVSALNFYGESSNSNEVSGTPGVVSADVLKIDFGTSSSAVQSDYEVYSAEHEQPTTFTAQSYSIFGTTVTVEPTWASGAEAAVMQMYDRSPNSDGKYIPTTTMEDLTVDWIGSDTRSTGDPLTLTISGLPAGMYNWLSYHHDAGTDAGIGTFDVTVNDASGSATTTDFVGTDNHVTTFDNIRTFETTIISDGSSVSLVFDTQPYADVYNEAWFCMNGFELGLQYVPNPNLPVLQAPMSGLPDSSLLPTLQWISPTAYTPAGYDVYLGTNPTATANPAYSVSTEEYTPVTPLDYETTYYWTVVAYDGTTPYTAEQTWSFTTVVEKLYPLLLSPSDSQAEVSTQPTLQWESPNVYTPDHYEVYFGTDPTVTANPIYTVSAEEFAPAELLDFETTYYWAVVAYDGSTPYMSQETWSFTTSGPFEVRDRVLGNMMLINDNGGWCWYQDDKIIYDPVGGNVLTSTSAENHGFGGVGASRYNDTDVTTFNIATGKRTVTLARSSGGDDHNMGALWVRPDGRYQHIYCDHYNNQVTYFRIGTHPYDGGSWGSEQSYNWELIPGPTRPDDPQTSSYTNVHYIASEDRLYNIIRVFDRTPCISYSDDWGETWNFMGRLNNITGSTTTYSNFYHKFRVHGDKIHFIGCEHHPRDFANSIYHGYIQNGKSYDSYGNELDVINDMDAPGIDSYTTVWATGPVAADQYHTAWTNEIEVDENGYPVCLFQTRYGDEMYDNRAGAGDHRFFYGRFNGISWTCTELGKLGGGMHTNEQDYTGMGCIHPDNVNIVYVSLVADPRDDTPLEHREIFKGVTSDNGLTWDWTQITFNSTEDNIRPAIPQWDANNTAVFWTRGIYPGQEDYDFVVVGMVEEEGTALTPVTYIDATVLNTTEADESAFTPTGPNDSPGAVDNQWHEYTGYGNGGSCYTAGDGGTEDAPAIKTTISDLEDGTYDVFAFFWSDPDLNWGVRGGFDASDMLCFSKQSSQAVSASEFTDSVVVGNGDYLLYRVYIGRQEVIGGSAIDVYLDNYDSSYSGGVPTRTTYDGVGVAKVIPDYDGDLNRDGRVDMIDISTLGQDWQTMYDTPTLINIAQDWLFGI